MVAMDVITLLGIILSFLIGAAGLIISLKNSRKTIFINSITSARIKYIQEIRNSISEYCGLIYRYNKIHNATLDFTSEQADVLKSLDKIKYQIILYLNPEDKSWDNKIIEFIEAIRDGIGKDQEDTIRQLITLTQYLLQLEWEGAKIESKKGLLSEKEKIALSGKYYQKYLEHTKSTGQV
jgi:hypothetical protein